MLRLRPAFLLLFTAALLSACGGGGGGNSSPATPPPPPATGAALTFTPASATASAQAGTSATINVSAAVNRPADFANAASVFAFISDDQGVLLPGAQLVRDSSTQYHAVLQTAPSLVPGNYQGNFTVKLCPDNACASQFPGSPMNLPYSIQVTPAGTAAFSATTAMPLTYTAHLGAPPPAAVIAVKAGSRNWVASASASWISLAPASGSGDGSVTVNLNSASLTPGNYTATITLTANDAQTVALPVALTVLPVSFQWDGNSITFTAVNGAPIASQSLSFGLDNGAAQFWNAQSSANWLTASPTSGITPSSVILSVNPATGNMAAGVYNSVVTFTSNNVATRQLPVTFNLVKPTLLPSATTITLGGPYGRDFSPQTWSLSLNTSTNTWPFTLSTVPSWVVVTPPSSLTVNKAPVNIVLTPDPTAVTAGISNAVLQATANVNGDAPTAGTLITINRDVHKLLPAETAVALSGTPGGARISRTIAVTDNFALGTAWTAASDQPWLTVTTTAGSLTMTADPTSLGVNTLNTANVAITPASADVAMPETIRVAFWKGSSAPTASTPLSLPYTNIVADPVRPLLYAHNGGAFIDVYNVYTQQKLSTITGFSAALGDMVVSPNGDHLYLIDINNHTLMTVDLNNLGITAQWPLPNSVSKSTRLRAIRPNGVEMVVLSDGTVWLATTGGRLPSIALAGGSLDATRDGKHLYQQDEGKSTVNLTTFSIDYAALAGGTLFAAKQASGSHAATGSQGQDLAASPDGSRIYTASTNPASCSALNPADLSIQYYLPSGNNPPNNVEVGSDGRVYCGVAGRNAAADVWVFSATGAPLKQIKFAAPGEQLAPRQMVISGDGFLLIGLTDAGTVDVVPIGP